MGPRSARSEQAAKIHTKSAILRSSVIYGTSSENFLTWALTELRDARVLNIVDDQIGSPTYAPDIAEACLRVSQRGITGLFHAAGPESISRYEFTKRLAKAHGHDTEAVNAISTAEAGQQATRPDNSALDSTNLYDIIDYEFRDCKSGLEACSP
ncbi:SDR family oxidoreductase (plasmid) [Haloarcula sp. NS06]|uniref:SDR family oxidoreductase n=1 Tax=Haloarcula sp. NS06 TaxID=3409688 RepID=UPI003DA73805